METLRSEVTYVTQLIFELGFSVIEYRNHELETNNGKRGFTRSGNHDNIGKNTTRPRKLQKYNY